MKFCRPEAPPVHARITCHPIIQNSHKNTLLFVKTGGADTAQHHPGSLGSGVKAFPTISTLGTGFWLCQPHLIQWECGGSSVRWERGRKFALPVTGRSPGPAVPFLPAFPSALELFPCSGLHHPRCQHTGELAAIPDSASLPCLWGTSFSLGRAAWKLLCHCVVLMFPAPKAEVEI